METVTRCLRAVGLFCAGLLQSFTDLFLSKPLWASLEMLENTDLQTTGAAVVSDEKIIKAKTLWERSGAVIMVVRRPGCLLCREEASELSSLKTQLHDLRVPLYAVVKEDIGTEIQDFKKFFVGEIFVDVQKSFYGPCLRKMNLLGFLRIGVWINCLRAWRRSFTGNLRGEGFILGGLFVIGPDRQGILLEHREKEFGHKVNLLAVLNAARMIQSK